MKTCRACVWIRDLWIKLSASHCKTRKALDKCNHKSTQVENFLFGPNSVAFWRWLTRNNWSSSIFHTSWSKIFIVWRPNAMSTHFTLEMQLSQEACFLQLETLTTPPLHNLSWNKKIVCCASYRKHEQTLYFWKVARCVAACSKSFETCSPLLSWVLVSITLWEKLPLVTIPSVVFPFGICPLEMLH